MSERPNAPTKDEIVRQLTARLFGQPIVQNNFRGEVIETILSYALDSTWTHCGADWAGWDFQSREGLRLQVRQSAAKQSWPTAKRVRASFSIKRSAGYWKGPIWHASPGRQAEIYVFAWHPLMGDDADHRDASQWRFWVVAERDLPAQQKSISLVVLQRKWGNGVAFPELGPAVAAAVAKVQGAIAR